MDADLSRWHHVREFSARDAVCLALGIDPADPAGQTWKAEPILRRMRWDYGLTVALVVDQLTRVIHNTALPPSQRRRPALGGLTGYRLRTLWVSPSAPDAGSNVELITRLTDRFDEEVFSRTELHEYFSSVAIVSVYDFDARAPEAPSVQADGQPDLSLDEDATDLTQDECEVEAFVDTGLVSAEVPGAPGQSPTRHLGLKRMILQVKGYREFLRSARRRPSKPAAASIESRPRFKQKMALQEDRIIEIICSLGFEPKSLPPAGRSDSVKLQVRKIALLDQLFTASVFDATWQRLRSDGRIGGGRTRRGGGW
jgi:hypothetical protein